MKDWIRKMQIPIFEKGHTGYLRKCFECALSDTEIEIIIEVVSRDAETGLEAGIRPVEEDEEEESENTSTRPRKRVGNVSPKGNDKQTNDRRQVLRVHFEGY